MLAVVTVGIYMGWYTPELTNPSTRLQGDAFWSIFDFVLNAVLFVLVGLQLPPCSTGSTAWTTQELIVATAAVAVRSS